MCGAMRVPGIDIQSQAKANRQDQRSVIFVCCKQKWGGLKGNGVEDVQKKESECRHNRIESGPNNNVNVANKRNGNLENKRQPEKRKEKNKRRTRALTILSTHVLLLFFLLFFLVWLTLLPYKSQRRTSKVVETRSRGTEPTRANNSKRQQQQLALWQRHTKEAAKRNSSRRVPRALTIINYAFPNESLVVALASNK